MNDGDNVTEQAPEERQRDVSEYYGSVLRSSADLRTDACCAPDSMPRWLKGLITEVHPEVRDRFYGCGSPVPLAVEARTVLDLGCGTGRDCYVVSRLAGPDGRVVGVDMTPEQLTVARRHRDYHARRTGLPKSNVEFLEGPMEDLAALGLEDASVDVVISNCVINLAVDKQRVFSEIARVLKPGGELYFSDIFADRRLPAHLARDPVLVGECLGGAMYREDFRRLMRELGFKDIRLAARSPVGVRDPDIQAAVGNATFESLTLRAFRLDLEDRCEDYGQVATYLGTMPHAPHAFELDDHHRFETGRPMRVCGNTADMLAETRYAPHFRVDGDKSVHFGLFDCAPDTAGTATTEAGGSGSCC